ncbi:hypothetical protein GCM10027605_25060 [Micromonospora zhanjiangensis]
MVVVEVGSAVTSSQRIDGSGVTRRIARLLDATPAAFFRRYSCQLTIVVAVSRSDQCGARPTPGVPMPVRIHLSSPDVGELEESYLIRALRSGWAAPAGPDLDAFERELADRVGTRHAVAVSSGTAALHLALLAVGAGPGTRVVVPTLTFVATANAVVYTGAEPIFVDCEPETGNLDPELLAELLRRLRADGEQVAAVLPVDMFGVCANYDALLPLCAAVGVPVVEDAAEALGAARHGRPAGSFGRAGVFSFNGNKIITTSGGGMIVSDDEALVARCRHLAAQARQPVAHYEHTEVGYNYRLSNLLAALGRAQLHRLDELLGRRRQLRERYAKLFATTPGCGCSARVTPGRTAGSPVWSSTRRGPAGTPVNSPRTSPSATSRRDRCGSRCICNPSSPGLAAW